MFVIEDILLRQFGIILPGLDMLWTIEQIRNLAYRELYNTEKIKNKIKENRLLYEFGEIAGEEYRATNHDLMQKLKLAQRAQEMNLGVRADMLGTG